MAIEVKCQTCSKTFMVPKCRATIAKFCSKVCFDIAQTTQERRTISCFRCGNSFVARKDHGVWPKYCSKECFGALARFLDCLECKKVFRATHQNSTFCSKRCQTNHFDRKQQKECLQCHKMFKRRSKGRKPIKYIRLNFCSRKCFNAHIVWKDYKKGVSYIDSTTGKRMVRVGYQEWKTEQRVVAEKILRRSLVHHSEPVINLNGDILDNRPENLFIYGSRGEFRSDLCNGIRPTVSNLSPLTYKKPKR